MNVYQPGFEESDGLRSAFIRDIVRRQLEVQTETVEVLRAEPARIPRRLVRYWHDRADLPDDVRVCLRSWDCLADERFELRLYDDISAAVYIADVYGEREVQAFARCGHPAMRSDYLRMCVVLAEGGLYVDADEVLLGEEWRRIFRDGRLKVQPLCYDPTSRRMVPATEIWRSDLPTDDLIYYVNNNPIAAPAGHPALQRALARATEKLLGEDSALEIQSTTGPGNLTAALAAHARELEVSGRPCDFELLRDWELIAEMRWNLSYRNDARNWRNVYGC
jgi:mannosyltransferase OCH1-like enzyme